MNSWVLVAGNVVSIFRTAALTCALMSALGVSACAGDGTLMGESFITDPFAQGGFVETSALPETVKLVGEAKLQFSQGHYGLAIDAFSKSIEKDSGNPDAWLGLAASYDQVGRFDQADKAYGKVQELIGPTPSVLNNLGYSYLLRGNLDKARGTLAAAYQGDPGNPYIVNNIEILNERLVKLGHPPMVMN
ncbi:MAG TPA: tetratricopeptide repeat protein [Hyphomicrobium sp.]|nr:tetratricopeptide repeat protein [Hyphomicrobium sp.]